MGDVAATGVLAACVTVVYLSNPLVLGIGNVLEPKAARAYSANGINELRRVVQSGRLLLLLAMSLFCLVIAAVGEPIMALLFDNPEYANQGHTLVVLSISSLMFAIIETAPPQPSLVDGKVNTSWDEILRRALAKDREERYQTVKELAEAVRDAPAR